MTMELARQEARGVLHEGPADAQRKLKVLDLFSGIGGFSLGLERTGGFETVAFCEIEEFPRRVLTKHWPKVPIYDDVRTLTADRLRADGITVDVICGGFPCQDISLAGKGAGLAGERSGLWFEYARLVGELRPQYVIVENVSALLRRGLDQVLGSLAAIRYDAEWHCVPAAHVGAPHIRDRLWIVAYPQHPDAHDAGPYRAAIDQHRDAEPTHQQVGIPQSVGAVLADAIGPRLALGTMLARVRGEAECGAEGQAACLGGVPYAAHDTALGAGDRRGVAAWAWRTEPDVGRVAYGVPHVVDRIASLGNAVVPQIPEAIGDAILASEGLSARQPDREAGGTT